jgi:hypothetical protein
MTLTRSVSRFSKSFATCTCVSGLNINGHKLNYSCGRAHVDSKKYRESNIVRPKENTSSTQYIVAQQPCHFTQIENPPIYQRKNDHKVLQGRTTTCLDRLTGDILSFVGHEERHEFRNVLWLLDSPKLDVALNTDGFGGADRDILLHKIG